MLTSLAVPPPPHHTLRSQRTVWVKQHLRVAINASIELVVSLRRCINIDLVRHHERRLRLPRDNEIPQITIVRLHIALTRAELQSLLE
jgi:hypothetical protein